MAPTWQVDAFGWDGAAIFGDLTHLVVSSEWLPSYIAGTRIGKMLAGAGWTLVNSALCP